MPITKVPGITPNIILASTLALKNAYIAAFKYVWYASIPFGVVSLACALSTKDVSLPVPVEAVTLGADIL